MKLFDCRVRVGGQIGHEVPINGVTEAEVNVLRSIHGADAVTGFIEAGEVADLTKGQIGQMLSEKYGSERVSKALNISLTEYAPIEAYEPEATSIEEAVAAPKKKGKTATTAPADEGSF
jgi:hypothetical protein